LAELADEPVHDATGTLVVLLVPQVVVVQLLADVADETEQVATGTFVVVIGVQVVFV